MTRLGKGWIAWGLVLAFLAAWRGATAAGSESGEDAIGLAFGLVLAAAVLGTLVLSLVRLFLKARQRREERLVQRLSARLGRRAPIGRSVGDVDCVCLDDLVEMPGFWDALELVGPMVFEGDSGSGDEVFDGAGCEDLVCACECGDPGANVHRDSPVVVTAYLAFAGMDACAYVESDGPGGVDDCLGAMYGARGTVEGRKEAIARCADLASAELAEAVAHQRVVAVELLAPPLVAELGDPLRRSNNVGEQDGREDAVAHGCWS
jgi:hypothetical protein